MIAQGTQELLRNDGGYTVGRFWCRGKCVFHSLYSIRPYLDISSAQIELPHPIVRQQRLAAAGEAGARRQEMDQHVLNAFTTSNRRCNQVCGCINILKNIAFPQSDDLPSLLFERLRHFQVSGYISPQLRDPVVRVPLEIPMGDSIIQPTAMPKISIDENNDSRRCKHKVRFANQPGTTAISESTTPKATSECMIRLPASAPD